MDISECFEPAGKPNASASDSIRPHAAFLSGLTRVWKGTARPGAPEQDDSRLKRRAVIGRERSDEAILTEVLRPSSGLLRCRSQ